MKKCKTFKVKKHRIIKGDCHNCYEKFRRKNCTTTKLRVTYSEIKRRCKTLGRGRDRYIGMEFCTLEEFLFKFKKDKNYLKLHKKWIESGRPYRLTPSIDRIDNNKGYIIDNLQFITVSNNSVKDKYTEIFAVTENKIVGIYESVLSASKELNINYSNVRNVLNTKLFQTKGYRFERLNDE